MSTRPPSGHRLLGYFEAIGAAALWGSSGIFAVHLFRLGLPPESVALLRPVVGASILTAYFVLADRNALRVSLLGLLVIGAGGGAVIGTFQLAYQLSIDAIGVPATVALLYLSPALVVAASGPLLGEWPTGVRVLLVAVTLSGVWLSVAGADPVSSTFGSAGLSWGVLAAAGYGGYTLLGRWAAPRFGPAATVVYSTWGGCVLLAVAVPAMSGPIVMPASTRAWVILLLFGLFTIAVAQFLFFDALARVEASRVSVATAIEPVVAAALAGLLLAQGLDAPGWAGIALVVAGVVGVGVTRDRSEPTPPGS